jgi:hypothetical protein
MYCITILYKPTPNITIGKRIYAVFRFNLYSVGNFENIAYSSTHACEIVLNSDSG